MFTNNQRQEERTGKYGSPRLQYLQELVSRFQNASNEETKEQIVANLANFAYDPFNYTFLRQLNVVELFLDCVTEPNERLVEFGIGGICNCCAVIGVFIFSPLVMPEVVTPGTKIAISGITEGPKMNTPIIEGLNPANASLITQSGGIPLVIQCLSSPVRNTVNYGLGALYYLCNASNKKEILKPEVVDVIKRYAEAGEVSVSFSNLAQAFFDKHVSDLK